VEGPFGEYLLYVGPQKLSQVLEVDALSWRRNATVVEIFTSHIDHLNAHVAIESSIFQKVRAAIPQVVGISWFRGGGPTTLVISVAKSSEGQPMRAALAAMAASNIIKQVIVVDDDVDIENSHDVLWAVSTRSRADEDITILHNLQGNLLDPSQTGNGKTSGFVIDATKPLGMPFPAVAKVPDSALVEYPMSSFSARRI
jgi:2,5-furandicarboxylate decarboxylase 1